MEKEKKKNIHEGHRQRLKRKLLNTDGEAIEPHEALELLLYYAIPQKNTNPIAHALLQKFGSLSGVLEADFNDLTEVVGIKDHAATLIKLQLAMMRMYDLDKYEVRNIRMTPENAGAYVMNLLQGYKVERLYAIMLDAENRLISVVKISEGTNDSSPVYPRAVVKAALETNAEHVILAHNHPNGILVPSKQDIDVTRIVDNALVFVNVRLIDHIIVAGNGYMSIMKELNKFHFLEDRNVF